MIRQITAAFLITAAAAFTVTAVNEPSRPSAQPLAKSDSGYCRDYARSAVSDYKDMISHPKCRVPDDGRWQPNYENHYNWCMKAPRAWRISESTARSKHLKNCGAQFTY